jgi:hypothetical protein
MNLECVLIDKFLFFRVNHIIKNIFNPDRSTTILQGGSNMTGTNCDLFTHKLSRSYLNHLVFIVCDTIKRRGNFFKDK